MPVAFYKLQAAIDELNIAICSFIKQTSGYQTMDNRMFIIECVISYALGNLPYFFAS